MFMKDFIEPAVIEEREGVLNLFLDHVPFMAAYLDTQQQYHFSNKSYRRFYGVDKESSLYGKHVAEVIGEEDYRSVRKYIVDALSGRQISFEMTLQRNGEKTFLKTTYIPHYDDAGEVKGFFATLEDLTEQKHTEALIRETEDRFRIMANYAPVALWMAGTDAKCNFFNQTWLQFTGRTMEEETGDGWAEGVYHEDLQHCMDTYLSAFNARREFVMEYRLRRDDGEYRWILDRGIPRFAPDGSFAGFIGSCVDITEQKLASEEILHMKDELERRVVERTAQLEAANKGLEAFSSSVSHDLRAPLRAIEGFSKALANDYSTKFDAQGSDYLQRVCDSCQQMSQLIDDLLNLSRVTRVEIRREEVNLSDIAQKVINELIPFQSSRKIEFEIAPDLTARGDERLLLIVMENLLGNAWKFTGNTPSARIEFGRIIYEGRPAYFVRDNGAGFEMAYADKLFKPFQRLHQADEFPGSGVGLATVERIVHRHGGLIWAESEVGMGASFYFTLPL